MTTVTMNETPSDIATAKAPLECTDSAGHVYVLKRPGVLIQYRVVEMVGETAKNSVWMAMVLPLFWVVSIDGEAVTPMTSKRMIEALIQQLGDEGVDAVLTAVNAAVGPLDPEADRETLKN